MSKDQSQKVRNESFEHMGHQVAIRTVEDRVELVIDDHVHAIDFTRNGRPHSRAYVNVMAKDVKDYAKRFIEFTEKQEAHWAEIDKERRKRRKS